MSKFKLTIGRAAATLIISTLASVQAAATDTAAVWSGPFPWNYTGTLERVQRPNVISGSCVSTAVTPRVLIAGDSWAQYLWDDDAHNEIFDQFGQADKRAVSRSLGSDPGAGYSGPAYAISGSEARQWANSVDYPYVANVVTELQSLPSIDVVMFSLGGNDVLAGKSEGGWYKDMDLDVPGSENALFNRIISDSQSIIQPMLGVRSGIDVLVSSYEYPNFNVSAFLCWIYACPKRNDLSRDAVNAKVTDAELNSMITNVESRRVAWTNAEARIAFDHGVGEMHHYYGDGVAAPGALPRPGQMAPDYLPFPGGQPSRPTLRENFRAPNGIAADPIHLDAEGYLYKVAVQTESYFFPRFRGEVSMTLSSLGGNFDGWTDGVTSGTDSIVMGDDGSRLSYGIVSFDTSSIPAQVTLESASLYLMQSTRSGSNPFLTQALGTPRLDVAAQFGDAQIEISDATAAADATDAGCFIGSADARYYAIRVDLTPAALAAIRRDGITQFRLAFSNTDAGVNRVKFSDGDATLTPEAALKRTTDLVMEPQADGSLSPRVITGTVLEHRGLVEVMGSARPFLDIRYRASGFADGFESE